MSRASFIISLMRRTQFFTEPKKKEDSTFYCQIKGEDKFPYLVKAEDTVYHSSQDNYADYCQGNFEDKVYGLVKA